MRVIKTYAVNHYTIDKAFQCLPTFKGNFHCILFYQHLAQFHNIEFFFCKEVKVNTLSMSNAKSKCSVTNKIE